MRPVMSLVGVSLSICLTVLAGGCGSPNTGPERGIVRGKVTVAGQPLDQGNITFIPANGKGPPTGGEITNGEFQLDRDLGPTLGEQIVRIRWNKLTGKKILDSDSGQEIDERTEGLAPKYHEQSQEKVHIKSGHNELKFDLTI